MPKVPRGPVAGHMRWNTGACDFADFDCHLVFQSLFFLCQFRLRPNDPLAEDDNANGFLGFGEGQSKTVRAPLPETVIPRPVAVGPL